MEQVARTSLLELHAQLEYLTYLDWSGKPRRAFAKKLSSFGKASLTVHSVRSTTVRVWVTSTSGMSE